MTPALLDRERGVITYPSDRVRSEFPPGTRPRHIYKCIGCGLEIPSFITAEELLMRVAKKSYGSRMTEANVACMACIGMIHAIRKKS